MGDSADLKLNCPLCCNETFSSRELLFEHLSTTNGNLFCPICNNKFPSIVELIEHLSHKNCPETESSQAIKLTTITVEHETNSHCGQNDTINKSPNTLLSGQKLEATEDSDVNKMYVEIMRNQTQDLEFMKDGNNQYVIVSQDHEGIVTKQNNDGTISLTSVKDLKMEDADPMISGGEQETDDNQEGLYSCNTCGVSFTSVIDHIQIYHNDQDVVVEEPMDETENEQIPIEFEMVENEESSTAKQTSRRVITETGDIVEAPIEKKRNDEDLSVGKQKVLEKTTGPGSKRYMRMNNLCDSVVRDLKNDQKSQGHEHKVLVKDVMTKDGECIKMYHCIFCNVYVSSLSDFKQHPCKNSKYSCLQCPVKYDNAKSLCAHMKVHKVKTDDNSEVSETFECEICSTVFPTNKSLKLHKRMHDPVKARQIEAPRNSDFSELRYLCQICEKMIPIDYKTIHENSHKNEEKMLNCGICNKKFTSEEYLEMHMNVHNLDKAPLSKQDPALPYSCVYCDRRFARPHEKVKHERIHTGEKPHECEICGKSFRVSYCLTLHMRTHTGARPYGCPHCGKRFKAHSVYNHHLLTHSEVRAYKCPYCPKAFKTSVQLAGHKNSHTKPFSCTHCNRPFASLYAVRVHTETHARQNNLKFNCELCGASYARAFALKDHMKQLHCTDVKTEVLLTSQEEWSVHNAADTSDDTIKSTLQELNEDIEEEMNQLEIPSDEFIVPN